MSTKKFRVRKFQDTMMLMRRLLVLVDELTKSGTFIACARSAIWHRMRRCLEFWDILLHCYIIKNNVAVEASAVTTWLEMEVGNELCKMFGL
ncbi:MAG: hypothetical protein IPK35_00220 [Saprospiraceae bacterium]|nr:hypothetical protein [Saprospiraceae bacterium]